MDRQEFLNTLRQALAGEVSTEIVNENMDYYNEYIVTEVRKGRTESDVMQSLGDPRLIAKTIIDTQGGEANASYVYEEPETEEIYEESSRRMFRLPGWAMLILIVVAACVVVGTVSSVVITFLPVILPVIAVVYLVRMFRR